MTVAVQLMTLAAYARHRGCDEKAVRKAIAEGRITAIERDGRKWIDPEVADIQWAKNTRARADSTKAAAAPPAESPAGDDLTYQSSRARREAAEAQLAELSLAKELGKVIERDRSVSMALTAFRSLRDGGMVLGRKLATRLAPMTDAREIQLAIDAAQRELFTVFATRTLPALIEQLAGPAAADINCAVESPTADQADQVEATA